MDYKDYAVEAMDMYEAMKSEAKERNITMTNQSLMELVSISLDLKHKSMVHELWLDWCNSVTAELFKEGIKTSNDSDIRFIDGLDVLVSGIESPVPESPVPESPVPESPVPESPVPESPVPESPEEDLPEGESEENESESDTHDEILEDASEIEEDYDSEVNEPENVPVYDEYETEPDDVTESEDELPMYDENDTSDSSDADDKSDDDSIANVIEIKELGVYCCSGCGKKVVASGKKVGASDDEPDNYCSGCGRKLVWTHVASQQGE
jgi:DNA-directed RNA polymerase subunit RPC12/RpoP